MTLYARADVMHVSVPVANGGCGQPHSRPVRNGAPDKEWALTCPDCETFLRQDIERSGAKKIRTVNADAGLKLADRYLGLWGNRKEMVPETYEHEIQREFDEQESVNQQAANSAAAFKQIGDAIAALAAQGQGNTALIQALANALTATQQPPVVKGEIVVADQPPTELPPGDYRCQDCGKISRRASVKGPAPKRCPDCKKAAA